MPCKKDVLEIWAKLLKNTYERIHFLAKRNLLLFSQNFQNTYFPEHLSVAASKTWEDISQVTFTCSKSTVETLEQGVKYVQS